MGGARRFYGNYAPWIFLGLGLVARALSRKGVDFAPKSVAIVALTWLVPIAVTRWWGEPGPGQRKGKLRKLLRTASPTVTVLLYKNVLFFLVPIWFDMPEDLKRVMSRQASAEREKRATITKAEGDRDAAMNLAAAAKTMAESPGAMQLRTLQTIDGLGPSASNTVEVRRFGDAVHAAAHGGRRWMLGKSGD